MPVIIHRTDVNQSSAQRPISGFTLIVPAQWGMAFWHSIAFCSVRIAGLRERAQQAFEAGEPSFPQDYLLTESGLELWTEISNAWKEQWDRKPPAKRVNYQKIGTSNPWNLSASLWLPVEEGGLATPTYLTGRRTIEMLEELSQTLANGDILTEKLSNLLQESWQKKTGRTLALRTLTLRSPSSHVCLMARLTPLSRGVPTDMAVIYHINLDKEWQEWQNILQTRRRREGDLGDVTEPDKVHIWGSYYQ